MSDEKPQLSQSLQNAALPISPSLGPTLRSAEIPQAVPLVDKRILYISTLSVILAVLAALIAKGLMWLIAIITNLCFFGRYSLAPISPGENHLGWWLVLIPPAGGIIVGLMARFGSSGIRGHGIPEAMERILEHKSQIPMRLTFLKPLSAAVAIGTGGPFGAEGPIIATGAALGSLIGQVLHISTDERKTLLAAGAAAGMAATFGSPVSAVLLAIELLLFEFRPRSFIPVALAATVATGTRSMLQMPYPIFQMPAISVPSLAAVAVYIALGAIVGVAAVGVTRCVYWVEDQFPKTRVHWMWWPAIGAVAVGVIGHFQPKTLGVGYSNISDVLGWKLTISAAAMLCVWKFVSWAIALGSGTSGGTLAPLFTIGGSLGLVLGILLQHVFPSAGVEPSVAALVGMAAIFAGASRAMLASAVFAFETTLRPEGLLPLLGGCAAAYLVSSLLMRTTIMTEKIVRRGVSVPAEYVADELAQIRVEDVYSRDPAIILNTETVGEIRRRFDCNDSVWSHQGYPVVDESGALLGVVTRRDFFDPHVDTSLSAEQLLRRPPIIVYEDLSLREVADHMLRHDVGRLPVMDRKTAKLLGIITRSDILMAQRRKVDQELRRMAQGGIQPPSADIIPDSRSKYEQVHSA